MLNKYYRLKNGDSLVTCHLTFQPRLMEGEVYLASITGQGLGTQQYSSTRSSSGPPFLLYCDNKLRSENYEFPELITRKQGN